MPSYVAIKEVQSRADDLGYQKMGAVVCDYCGEKFLLEHPAKFADTSLAAKQAKWIERVLAEDHHYQRSHPDKIAIPKWLPL